MPVLKPSASIRPQTYSLRDVEKQAEMLLAHARQKAEGIITQAIADAAEMHSKARTEGFAEGREDGLKAGRDQGLAAGRTAAIDEVRPQMAGVLKSLIAASEQLDSARQQLHQAARSDICALAVAIARKVVRSTGATNPAVVSQTVTDAVKFVIGQNNVRIAVNPAEQKTLQATLPALQVNWPALKHVEIIGDADVAQGGARILTSHGEVDATLDGMIDRIAGELCGGEL